MQNDSKKKKTDKRRVSKEKHFRGLATFWLVIKLTTRQRSKLWRRHQPILSRLRTRFILWTGDSSTQKTNNTISIPTFWLCGVKLLKDVNVQCMFVQYVFWWKVSTVYCKLAPICYKRRSNGPFACSETCIFAKTIDGIKNGCHIHNVTHWFLKSCLRGSNCGGSGLHHLGSLPPPSYANNRQRR